MEKVKRENENILALYNELRIENVIKILIQSQMKCFFKTFINLI